MRSGYRNTAWAVAVVMALGAGMVLGQTTFNDVPDSDPRLEDIDYAAAQGWFRGYPDGSFQPDRQITETQLAQVIRRARPGLTRGDAAVFVRGGMDRLQATAPTTTTTAAAGAATTTAYTAGQQQGQTNRIGWPPAGAATTAPSGGGPVDQNPPVAIEPTTTTTTAAETAATTTTPKVGPGEEGPVDQNPPVVIEPTTTTTVAETTATTTAPNRGALVPATTTTTTAPAAATTTTSAAATTTTTAPAATYYYNSRAVPAEVAAGVAAGRVMMRYGWETGWTDPNGRSGSLFWFESYIRDYDFNQPEDRALSFWAVGAETSPSFRLYGTRSNGTIVKRAGYTGVYFVWHLSDSLPPRPPSNPANGTSMPRLHIAFVPGEIQRVEIHREVLWSGRPYSSTSLAYTHVMEKIETTPERAKVGARISRLGGGLGLRD